MDHIELIEKLSAELIQIPCREERLRQFHERRAEFNLPDPWCEPIGIIREQMKEQPGIYRITTPSGRIYVGQTKDLAARHYSHRYSHNFAIKKSIEKYGYDALKFDVLKLSTLESTDEDEQSFLTPFFIVGRSGLARIMNAFPTARSTKGAVFTPEWRKKISESALSRAQQTSDISRKNWANPEYRKAISEKMSKSWSSKTEEEKEEHSRKVSEAKKKAIALQTEQGVSQWQTMTPDQKAEIARKQSDHWRRIRESRTPEEIEERKEKDRERGRENAKRRKENGKAQAYYDANADEIRRKAREREALRAANRTPEQIEALRASRKAKLENETPEEREARLIAFRAYHKEWRERKKLESKK